MREEVKCAGCDTWYDPAEEEGACPFCDNENISDVRGRDEAT